MPQRPSAPERIVGLQAHLREAAKLMSRLATARALPGRADVAWSVSWSSPIIRSSSGSKASLNDSPGRIPLSMNDRSAWGENAAQTLPLQLGWAFHRWAGTKRNSRGSRRVADDAQDRPADPVVPAEPAQRRTGGRRSRRDHGRRPSRFAAPSRSAATPRY